MTNSIKAILTRAKKLIIDRGWAQGTYQTGAGEICASQAIMLAGVDQGRTESPAYIHFAKANGISSYGVSGWNDQQMRVEDVLAAFDKAISAA